MAARSVRCLVSNQTPFDMVHVSDSHSSGEFTDPFFPPPTILAGKVVEWRSESDGFLTGAVGTARYSVGISTGSGAHTEFIDFNWDNPFIGANSSSIFATNDFSGTPSTDLQCASFIQSGTVPNAAKVAGWDVEAWLDTFLFPPYILANATSRDNTNAFYGVGFQQPAQFSFGGEAVDITTLPRKPNVDANPQEWQGQWQGGGVCVTLTELAGGRMSAFVTDQTISPMSQFSDQFVVGSLSSAGQHLISAQINKALGLATPVSNVFRTASLSALLSSEPKHNDVFSRIATKLAKQSGVRLDKSNLVKAGASISTIAASCRSTSFLSHGVFLTLYDAYSGNTKQGQVFDYQRYDEAGTLLTDAILTFVPILH